MIIKHRYWEKGGVIYQEEATYLPAKTHGLSDKDPRIVTFDKIDYILVSLANTPSLQYINENLETWQIEVASKKGDLSSLPLDAGVTMSDEKVFTEYVKGQADKYLQALDLTPTNSKV